MDKQIFRLIGKSITLAAMAYRVRSGRNFVRPPAGASYAESFLYMLVRYFPPPVLHKPHTDCPIMQDHLNEPNYRPHPVIVKALDTLFLLHADVRFYSLSTVLSDL
jgi:citrate synthase